MNAIDFMAAWERSEIGLCLSSIRHLDQLQLTEFSQGFSVSSLKKLSSLFFFARQLNDQQTLAYARLLKARFEQVSRMAADSGVIGESCERLSLSISEYMEAAYLRGDLDSMQSLFSCYTTALSCLSDHCDSGAGGKRFVKRGLMDRWAEALSYDFSQLDGVSAPTLAFINKTITLKKDRIASTMLYSLRQQAKHYPAAERTGIFSKGVMGMLGMMAKSELLVIPEDPGGLIKEIDNLQGYFLPTEGVSSVRNELLTYLLHPGKGGRWLGNTYARSGRKPQGVREILALGRQLDTVLQKPESKLALHEGWKYKVGLITALCRHKEADDILERNISSLASSLNDDQLTYLLRTVTPKAIISMARAISHSLPAKLNMVNHRLGEEVFVVDLGL